MTMISSCGCGAVKVNLRHRPEFINSCNCSFCDSAAADWGYFDIKSVEVIGQTKSITRADKLNPVVAIHICEVCSITTHWKLTKAHEKRPDFAGLMGVNMRLFDDKDLKGIEMRFPDGKAWSGQGRYDLRKPSITLGI